MPIENANPELSKKRKRRPRTARACNFCRRRKVRCSGTLPCDYCVNEEAHCEYGGTLPAATRSHASQLNNSVEAPALVSTASQNAAGVSEDLPSTISTHVEVSGVSTDPLQPFTRRRHIAPTSGVSFLYYTSQDLNIEENSNGSSSTPLVSHGDPEYPRLTEQPTCSLPEAEKAKVLLDGYFRFAMPTYRFHHRPTLEMWTSDLLIGKPLVAPKAACVWLVCAQSLLYTNTSNRHVHDDADFSTSRVYFENAKALLQREAGPATLASVQARLTMCLYMLGTFRVNECRFTFAHVNEILTSLGLQRKDSLSHKLSLVESESRKRTFWCAYILDSYLSVLLGRPRLLRDADIDQSIPQNFDDQDLSSSESPDELPLHGNLEAFIGHVELANILGRNNDLLYPLLPLGEDEQLHRTNEILEALQKWCDGLPKFLRPREKTLYGQRTFERQNTVLKLAHAHVQILATRQCLLTDFTNFGRTGSVTFKDDRAVEPVRVCIRAANTIITVCDTLMQRDSFYQAFWFTQYVSLVGISTLYVFLIQGARCALPAMTEVFCDREEIFDKAKKCQSFLASIAPKGSQSRRHHQLLDRLRLRVENDILHARRKAVQQQVPTTARDGASTVNLHSSSDDSVVTSQVRNSQNEMPSVESLKATVPCSAPCSSTDADSTQPLQLPALHLNDTSTSDDLLFQSLNTLSSEDRVFQDLLDSGWQNFDTMGLSTQGELHWN